MRWLDRLLVLLAAGVVLVSLLPLGARYLWVLELTSHFRLQYLALAVLLLPFVALRRRWGACAALLFAAATSATSLFPYLPVNARPQTAVAAEAATPVKLLTVNVSYKPFSARQLLQLIGEAAPDVLVVQEFTPHAARVLADLDGMFAANLKFPAEGPYGIALWSRYELEGGATFALGRRPAVEARVLRPAGAFMVIGVHLSAPVSARRAAARNQELLELGARTAAVTGPLIVAGDFNITPYSPYFTEWLAQTGLTDTRRGRTLSMSWPTTLRWVGIPIDHVAVSRDIDIVSHEPLPDFGSDHFGVITELAVPSGAQRP